MWHPILSNPRSSPSSDANDLMSQAIRTAFTHSQPTGTGILFPQRTLPTVALVAWDRVYEDQHWTSDVTATIALSAFVSSVTVRWLETHLEHH